MPLPPSTAPGFRLLAALCLLASAGCDPDGPDVPGIPEGSFVVDVAAFYGDQLAVAASWYDYDMEQHTVSPKDVKHIVVDESGPTPRTGAFRVTGYYNPDTGVSGFFALDVAQWDGNWFGVEGWTTSHSIRVDGPLCIDLFAIDAGTGGEVPCEGDQWQVQFRVYPLFVPEAGIVIGNPGVFLRSVAGAPGLDAVKVATLDGDFSSFPDPTTLSALEDGPAAAWHDVEWDRGLLATNLPARGMVIGPSVTELSDGPGDVVFLLTADRELVRFVSAIDDAAGEMTFSFAVSGFDDASARNLPFSEARSVTVKTPEDGELSYHRFAAEDLVAFEGPDPLVAQLSPPMENEWDFALERVSGGLRLVLSPSSTALNHTATGGEDASSVDDAMPPIVSDE